MAKKTKVAQNIFGDTKGSPLQNVFAGLYTPENVGSYIDRKTSGNGLADEAYRAVFDNAALDPLTRQPVAEGFTNTGLGTTAGLAGNWIKDHKLKSAGLGLGIGANLAGLFDNPNMAGQLLGGAGAGIGANLIAKHLLKKPLTASGTALWALGGGALGSLFDKLMYKKQQEQQQQYY